MINGRDKQTESVLICPGRHVRFSNRERIFVPLCVRAYAKRAIVHAHKQTIKRL